MPARTRRSVLSTLAAGAAVATAGVAAAAPSAAAGPGLRLVVSGSGLRRLDAGPASVPSAVGRPVAAVVLPRAGDRCVVSGAVLLAGAVGTVGTFLADVVLLADHGRPPDLGAAVTYEQHLLTLPEGTIAGTGTTDRHGRGSFAVVGGTGAYSGARGTYVVEQHRLDLGGDGRAHFDISLDR